MHPTASFTCLASVTRAAGHSPGWLGLLHKLGRKKASPSVQVMIHPMLTSHSLVSHWARQSDSLAQSQHRRGSMQGQGTGRCDSWGAIHVTSYHALYGAVSPAAWEAPLEQACSCFLLIPQYSAYSPAGWGQAGAAAGSQSSVQGAVQKRLSVTACSSVLVTAAG